MRPPYPGEGSAGPREPAAAPERSWERWERVPEEPEERPAARNEPRGRTEEPVLPEEVQSELASSGGRRAPGYTRKLSAATRSYERERYEDARRILAELVRELPDAASVRELYGLTLYRMGRWKQAATQLRAFWELTGSYDQYPVMADCERAMGHHGAVQSLVEELRSASAGSDLTSEGRLVLAGSLADQGLIPEAIRLLEPHAKALRHPAERHLRTWYALADLYERAGELPRARALFAQVASQDPSLGDSKRRSDALG